MNDKSTDERYCFFIRAYLRTRGPPSKFQSSVFTKFSGDKRRITPPRDSDDMFNSCYDEYSMLSICYSGRPFYKVN